MGSSHCIFAYVEQRYSDMMGLKINRSIAKVLLQSAPVFVEALASLCTRGFPLLLKQRVRSRPDLNSKQLNERATS
eukprot:scaffold4107_cov224-Skeletonema_marinoi.AAC.10